MYRAILTPKQDKPPCLYNCIAVQGENCNECQQSHPEQYERCDEFECDTCSWSGPCFENDDHQMEV